MLTQEEYSMPSEQLSEYLKKVGIEYPEPSCPFIYHPEGWDFSEKLFHKGPLGEANSCTDIAKEAARQYTLAVEAGVPWMAGENSIESIRFCLVRSQLFVSKQGDPCPSYVIFQPKSVST